MASNVGRPRIGRAEQLLIFWISKSASRVPSLIWSERNKRMEPTVVALLTSPQAVKKLVLCTKYWEFFQVSDCNHKISQFQWPRLWRRRTTATRLLGLRVRIYTVAWMSVSCECCVLIGRGLCDGPISRPEESYRVWCVCVWSQHLNNVDA
jgi:hypothetical protein